MVGMSGSTFCKLHKVLHMQQSRTEFQDADTKLLELQSKPGAAIATLAGGCFWCLQAPFEQRKGVFGTIAGYAGGKRTYPTYEQVITSVTGHRESVQVFFDPSVITYSEILDIFWLQIDVTDPGGQFADRGFQYTTAIFVHDAEQRGVAVESKRLLQSSLSEGLDAATRIENFSNFFPAEDYHQQFYMKQPDRYYSYKQLSGRR